MSIILSKIKNGLITGEDMWMSILMTTAIVIGLVWFFSVAWQRNELLRERVEGLSSRKGQILKLAKIALALLVIGVMFKTYLAYMTLADAVVIFLCYHLCRALLDKLFSVEWSFEPSKTSTVIYAVIAAACIVYIKAVGPFFSTPSVVVFALVLSDGIREIAGFMKRK